MDLISLFRFMWGLIGLVEVSFFCILWRLTRVVSGILLIYCLICFLSIFLLSIRSILRLYRFVVGVHYIFLIFLLYLLLSLSHILIWLFFIWGLRGEVLIFCCWFWGYILLVTIPVVYLLFFWLNHYLLGLRLYHLHMGMCFFVKLFVLDLL